MTVEAVAARAAVSAPTVYLRYPTKLDLALAAVAHIPVLADPPDTGGVGEAMKKVEVQLHNVYKVTYDSPSPAPRPITPWNCPSPGAASPRPISGLTSTGRGRPRLGPCIEQIAWTVLCGREWPCA